MVKTKLKLQTERKFKTQLMQAKPGQIAVAVDNTQEIRVIVLGTLDDDGRLNQQQVGANWVVNSLDEYTALGIGTEITIIQQ